MKKSLIHIGRSVFNAIEEFGYAFMLLVESLEWFVFGKMRKQSVRMEHIFHEAVSIGVRAVPIASVLCFSVGIMLALQGLETLKPYGAQSQVVTGIALSVTREFSALIIGIIVAGRSGSAITARLGTMKESQEIDALRVIGINPVRYLAAPILIAMMLVLPLLTVIGDFLGMLGGAVYTSYELNITVATYLERSFEVLKPWDVGQGLAKSLVFAIVIVLVSVSNGFKVSGGSEGVGRATTRSVVLSISYIIVVDMIFTFFLTR